MRSTYENFYATCPWCLQVNIFSRVSDWHDCRTVDFKEVKCLYAECGKQFCVKGDLINPCYEMLIFDCYELLDSKQYSYCMLNLSQAFEVFFSQYLRVTLLYIPLALQEIPDPDAYNCLLTELEKKIEPFSYGQLLALFLHSVVRTKPPRRFQESRAIIDAIHKFKVPKEPTDNDLRNPAMIADPNLRDLLLRLKSCEVPKIRNRVVHKSAYRPNLDETRNALKETREILFPLGQALGIQFDEIDCYRPVARRGA